MRVITGTARGTKLATLDSDATRPTADMVKEAIFSMIQFDLEGRVVLDLFGGSGQLAIEALSRGAERAVIVDSSREATAMIIENAKKTNKHPLSLERRYWKICHQILYGGNQETNTVLPESSGYGYERDFL